VRNLSDVHRSLWQERGSWFHPAFGAVAVELAKEQLALKFNAMTLPLEHFNYDTFRVAQLDALVKFRLDASGKPAEMLLPLEPAAADLVFVKR
jgi:hypothetical protein